MAAVSHQPAEDLIARARALAPLLAEEAAEAERLRRPTDRAIAALRESDVFRLMVPRAYGGLELDLDTFLEVGLALGEGDASLAWVTTFYIEHNWMLCQFPEPYQAALLGGRSYVLAPAAIAPNGVAEPMDGGFRLNGRWAWGTGVMHAEEVIVGARIADGAEVPDFRFLALARDQVKVEDTWFVDGMSGTGSNDILIENVVVPDERSVSMADMADGCAHGARLHAGPLYRTPMLPILSLAASMPAVAQARVAVRGFRERMQERIRYCSKVPQSQKPAAQMRLARADLEVGQAEALLRSVVAEVMALREEASLEERARWSASCALAVDQSKRVLQAVAEASGASAHFLDHPLQRAVRDVNTIACHVVFDLDQRLEMYGRAMLGRAPGGLV